MKTKTKVVLLALCMAALIVVSVLGTMAYLTSTDTVTNTFTVGKVQIKLDEARVDDDGAVDTSANGRVKANSYKLLPGHTYNKDPMVTVTKGSEEAYIKMTVTFTKSAALDEIFKPNGANMTSIFTGYDSTKWISKGNTENGDTRTYEFWYYKTVDASEATADMTLEPLFTKMVVPGSITNEQLKTIEGMTITVNAYAIQADGFATPEAAWAAFPAE